MSPNNWGPPTWIFMHTLCEKIKEESFHIVGPSLINLLSKICFNLPCPECSQHAKKFWGNVKQANINNKRDLMNLMFVFHNVVNKRKHLPPFKYIDLQYYKTKNIIETYNSFQKNFNTKGNMNLIAESFHRNMMLSNLKKWMMENIKYFEL